MVMRRTVKTLSQESPWKQSRQKRERRYVWSAKDREDLITRITVGTESAKDNNSTNGVRRTLRTLSQESLSRVREGSRVLNVVHWTWRKTIFMWITVGIGICEDRRNDIEFEEWWEPLPGESLLEFEWGCVGVKQGLEERRVIIGSTVEVGRGLAMGSTRVRDERMRRDYLILWYMTNFSQWPRKWYWQEATQTGRQGK